MSKTNTYKWIVSTVLSVILIVVISVLIFSEILRPKAPIDPLATQSIGEIDVAYLPIYVDLPLFVAQEEGLFEKRGLRVDMKRFENSPDMNAALVSGRVDAVASIATPTIVTTEARDPGRFRVFMVDQATAANPLSSLLVPSNSDVTSVLQLKGKTIGSFPGPTATILSPLAFQHFGLSPGDYNLTSFPPSNHIGLLETGQVDAIVTYEPTATQAVVKNGSKRLVKGFIEGSLMDPWPAGTWLVSSELYETELGTQQAKAFSDAIHEATDMLRNDPQAMKRHLTEYTLIEADVALAAPNIPFTKAKEVSVDSYQGYADLLLQQGVIDARVDMRSLLILD